ncbi:capsular biosynthesis protein [Pelagerythrobacter sp.]|uniref:capsular biosynthesis protein n=1 Tax=Pelagerythrobacter sp. TaxID=2800702 RepID=UPI0035AE0502
MRIILDVDGTLTVDDPTVDYADRLPRRDVIERVNHLHRRGATIVVYSARNMRTHRGNVGKINKHTLPVLLDWLDRHSVAFDEIHMGKPWCGTEGFYVHDRSMRPSQFLALPLDELDRLMAPAREGHAR